MLKRTSEYSDYSDYSDYLKFIGADITGITDITDITNNAGDGISAVPSCSIFFSTSFLDFDLFFKLFIANSN